MEEILKVDGINCGYGKKPVLKNISFSVKEGEIVGIIGPNGSGKTTLAKVISRNLKPYSGYVYYKGKDIFKLHPILFSRQIAYLPSDFEIYFPYSVEEFVSMGRFPYTGRFGTLKKDDREAINESLHLLDIFNLKDRNVQELSEGEKQRVFLAQVIAQQTPLLLLDEPVSHLDIGYKFSIMDLLKRLNKERGITVLIILHDLNLASEYCDRLILLHKGCIYKDGSPDEVLEYKIIEEVYETKVLVYKNPFTNRPYVFGIPEKI
ncbi:MAG: ABC transporter [Candidatus Omnitrophota bacterium]|nr:MAG: ABC transporter [Candidatus Omnitrophota bacterium]